MKKLIYFFLIIGFIFLYFIFEAQQFTKKRTVKLPKNPQELALEWIKNNQRDKGLFYYIYYPKKDEHSNKNNALRQLMMSNLVAELASEDDTWLPMHEKNLNFVMKYWYKEKDGNGYVFYNDKSKLGANAMLLRTLVNSPNYKNYEKEAKAVADGILFLVQENASFVPWLIEPSYDYDSDYLLTFYSGEALLSLLEYYEKTNNNLYLESAKRVQDFYIKEYVDNLEKNYYPAYVPWHTMSLYHLFNITKEEKYKDAIFVLNDKLLEIQDKNWHVGRFYNTSTPQYGTPHSSSDGVYTEGLVYAYAIAKEVGDKERENKYYEALEIAFDNLFSLQYGLAEDENIRGALAYNNNNPNIRVDTVQHFLDAIRAYNRLVDKNKIK